MKRVICCICTAALCFLALMGCSNTQQCKEAVTEFSATAEIYYVDEQLDCTLSADISGISLNVNSGSMSGIRYECRGDEIKASFGSVEIKTTPPASALPHALNSALGILRNGGAEHIECSDTKCKYKGESDSGVFYVTVDKNTGYISELNYDSINLNAKLAYDKAA